MDNKYRVEKYECRDKVRIRSDQEIGISWRVEKIGRKESGEGKLMTVKYPKNERKRVV